MLHFLARENLGPFYHVKAHLVMSIAELDGESQQVILASARSHLDEAETALKVAKDCYTATDQVLLDDMEKDIRDRRAALEKYEVDVDANEDGGVGL